MHLCSSKTFETELYDYVTKSDFKDARKFLAIQRIAICCGNSGSFW